MKQQQSITTLPPSPDEERRSRMIKYTVTMGIRMVCIVLMLFVHGWWLVVCALGAILLPYFAMIAANVHGDQRATPVMRPGAIVLSRGAQAPYRSAARPDADDTAFADDSAFADDTIRAADGEDAR